MMRSKFRCASTLVVVLTTACVAGGGDSSGFPSYPSPTGGKNDALDDGSSSDSAGDDDSADDDSSASADGDATTSMHTDSGDAETTGVDPSATGAQEDGSATATTGVDPTGDPGPGQPATGLWAQCTAADYNNCNFSAPVCISGMFMNGAEDGFCSKDMCANPVVDCAPVPIDSNATPICVTAQDEMMMNVYLCALDCSQGQTCPAGMNCIDGVSFGDNLPIYSFCV